MNRQIARILSLAILLVLSAVSAQAQEMEVTEIEARPASVGASEYFTGTAMIEPLFSPNASARASAARVQFAPGARTAWHSHPRGQRLVVTSGRGWVKQRNGERRTVGPGDVVWTPPGVEHWHGATPTHAMSHIAIQEAKDGSVVNWMELVSDDAYQVETEE